MLKITFLGTGGAIPTPNRNPSAILVNLKGDLMLFDCGEGTQRQMMRAKTGMKINAIFITHFHGDHTLGIPGLLQTLSFNGRTQPLPIYGPKWTQQFIRLLVALGFNRLGFEITAHELKPGDTIERENCTVKAIKTDHGTPSLGYLIQEHTRPGKFNKQEALRLGVPEGPLFSKLQRGEPVKTPAGVTVQPSQVLGPPRPGRKVVYTGDTRPTPEILEASQRADLIIHDSTLTSEMQDWAIETKHSTASEAAQTALKAGARRLILTHISSRYSESTQPLLEEGKKIFPTTQIAEELMEIEIPYQK